MLFLVAYVWRLSMFCQLWFRYLSLPDGEGAHPLVLWSSVDPYVLQRDGDALLTVLAVTSRPDAAPSLWRLSQKCSLYNPWPPRPLSAQTANWLGFLFSLMGTPAISVCLQTFCLSLILRAVLSVFFMKEQCASTTTVLQTSGFGSSAG